MSGYISKEALLEELNRYEKELYKDKRDAIDSDDEMMLFAIQNQETAISRITRSVMHSIPTLDETEIIRKFFERVVEMLEELTCYVEDGDGHAGHFVFTEDAIKIVKEECGTNE